MTKTDPKLRIEDLKAYFLTTGGTPRTRLMTKALQDRDPGLYATLTNAQSEFVRLCEERVAHTLINATLALWRLADAVSQRYADSKARGAALDFDDLIARTESLLKKSDWTQWVLYKLDNGLEHILVDEAQDTSPSQWAIVKSLAAEFFAGRGAHEVQRTVFAVGDEKQSIYSFQGAAPKLFAETGQLFAERARAARLKWETVPLTLSFRSQQLAKRRPCLPIRRARRDSRPPQRSDIRPDASDRWARRNLADRGLAEKPPAEAVAARRSGDAIARGGSPTDRRHD